MAENRGVVTTHEEDADLLGRKGGTMAIDFIKAVG